MLKLSYYNDKIFRYYLPNSVISLSAFLGSTARRLIQGRDGEIDHGCQPAQAKNSQDSLVVYPS